MEGNSTVWLTHHGNLINVASQHLRQATAEEHMAVKYVLEEMAQMNGSLVMPRHQSRYIDLTHQEGDPWGFEVPQESTTQGDQEATSSRSPAREPDQEPMAPRSPESEVPRRLNMQQPGMTFEEVARAASIPVPEEPTMMDVDGDGDIEMEAAPPDVNVLAAKNQISGRGTRELNPKHFDASERKAFAQADRKQLKVWKEKKAITVIPESEVKKIPKDRILPGRARMVRTNKAKEGEPLEARSRIVVPGHLDQDLGSVRSDAPTAPQLALHMMMQVAATFKWKLQAFDVEAAFLNGVPLERELYVRPPMDLPGQNPNELWRLEKAVFGLTEAPRYWWLRIRKDMLETGWVEVPFMAATFAFYDAGKLAGVALLHVDDGMLAGKGKASDKID